MTRAHQPRGFTLIEVLVALAIVAVALAAGARAAGALTDNAERLAQMKPGCSLRLALPMTIFLSPDRPSTPARPLRR